jgi:hypothetical protein
MSALLTIPVDEMEATLNYMTGINILDLVPKHDLSEKSENKDHNNSYPNDIVDDSSTSDDMKDDSSDPTKEGNDNMSDGFDHK